jgi:alkylation response protein AidB-like acyl-CoA dehydrogenase
VARDAPRPAACVALTDGGLQGRTPERVRRLIEESIEEYTIEASILKVFGTETLDFVADEALQILGGYSLTAEYPGGSRYRRQPGGPAAHPKRPDPELPITS